jgi:hypothetical protein
VDAARATARHARLAAEAVLLDGEASVERWIEAGEDAEVGRSERSSRGYSFERDAAASAPLRALPLPVKRKWLLEMLRWELGPVSAGVPIPGLIGVSLVVDRRNPLRDLCRHCELPKRVPEDSDAFSSSEDDAPDPASSDPGASGHHLLNAQAARDGLDEPAARVTRGSFLSPPRGGVSIRFLNEHGEGAALRREWFSLVADASSNFAHGLFASYDSGMRLHPHACSGFIHPRTHLKYFASLGRVAAAACYHGETFPLRLTEAFYDRVLGRPARLDDLRSVDPTLHANVVEYLRAVPADALDSVLETLDLRFEDIVDPAGVFQPGESAAFALPRRRGGGGGGGGEPSTASASESERVTSANLPRYLRAFVANRCYGNVAQQTAAFAAGFGTIVPPPLRVRMRGMLSGGDVAQLVAGERGAVDVADWKANAGYAEIELAFSFSTRCFWEALERLLLPAEKIGVLQFATGLATAPAGGFANLVGYAGDSAPFTIAELSRERRDAPGALPMAHACFNTIRLPRLKEEDFQSQDGTSRDPIARGAEEMARRLRVAVENGVRGFDNF